MINQANLARIGWLVLLPDAIFQPDGDIAMRSDYERIAAAIHFIERNVPNQPTLAEIASELGMSPFHFQRLFQRWAGVSPKRFLQFLTVEYAKQLLKQSKSVLDTTYELGLSGPARLHDHFVSLEAVTPGEYKKRGAGLQIRYGVHAKVFLFLRWLLPEWMWERVIIYAVK